ncbi:MAG TPA: hypothetical protein VK979_06580, partial [Guyparkeria sp.]|nr:hypothetical protein [Guyparkeria sp.]
MMIPASAFSAAPRRAPSSASRLAICSGVSGFTGNDGLILPSGIARIVSSADCAASFISSLVMLSLPCRRSTDMPLVKSDLQQQIKEAFDTHDITIPFPQMLITSAASGDTKATSGKS